MCIEQMFGDFSSGKSRSTSRKFCRHASEDSRTRYPKSNNLGKTGSESQIKQTSSLELEQQDGFQCWNHMQAQMLNDHPQSLEIISIVSKKEDAEKNKIPSHPQSLEVSRTNVQFSVYFIRTSDDTKCNIVCPGHI